MFTEPILSRTPRTVKRQRVLITATLFTPEGAVRVRLRDISSTGAHIFAEGQMLTADAIFKKGTLFVAARVIWRRGKEAGLKFYRELSSDEIAAVFN